MIRFKTIDPADTDKTGPKPAAPKPDVTPDVPVQTDGHDTPAPAPRGLTRKTPLRAKKPDGARLFRD